MDNFVKHVLRIPYYLRYCDDFIFLSNDENILQSLLVIIREFLQTHLKLEFHPKKVIPPSKLSQVTDFVEYVLFSRYRRVRTRTQQRLKKAYIDYLQGKITSGSMDQQLQSSIEIYTMRITLHYPKL